MTAFLRIAALVMLLPALAGMAPAQDAEPSGTRVDLEMEEHDSSQPLEITSDDLKLDRGSNTATFTGDVVAIQGNLTLTGDRMVVEYARSAETGANEVVRVTVTGNVVMVQEKEDPEAEADVAESQRAVYTVETELLVMTVDVLVVQDGTVLTSDKLTYDLATGRGVMEGRVTTLMMPEGE